MTNTHIHTELESRGLDLSSNLWSAAVLGSHPDTVRSVHEAYIEAGADVIISASYQASVAGFVKAGFTPKRSQELLHRSSTLACAARDAAWKRLCKKEGTPAAPSRRRPRVAVSLGSYGAYLADGSEYSGKYGASIGQPQLVEFHRQRLRHVLAGDAGAGVDLLACETIPCLLEVEALIEVLQEDAFRHVPVWFSFSCATATLLHSGEQLAKAVELLEGSLASQLVAVGVNCVKPDIVAAACGTIAGVAPLPKDAAAKAGYQRRIVVYPNSGEDWDAATNTWQGSSGGGGGGSGGIDKRFAAEALKWQEAGAALIGGCCRTSPSTICSIRGAFLGST